MLVSLIVAIAENGVIGHNNQLIWHLPNDLKYFKKVTSGNAVIMGRKTFESIGKPLPNRTNIVVSRNTDLQLEGCELTNSIESAIEIAKKSNSAECFVIGGAEIYRQALPMAHKIYLTRVYDNPQGDTVFDIDISQWHDVSRIFQAKDDKNALDHEFIVLERNSK
jgi:dihydrofolate reductase